MVILRSFSLCFGIGEGLHKFLLESLQHTLEPLLVFIARIEMPPHVQPLHKPVEESFGDPSEGKEPFFDLHDTVPDHYLMWDRQKRQVVSRKDRAAIRPPADYGFFGVISVLAAHVADGWLRSPGLAPRWRFENSSCLAWSSDRPRFRVTHFDVKTVHLPDSITDHISHRRGLLHRLTP